MSCWHGVSWNLPSHSLPSLLFVLSWSCLIDLIRQLQAWMHPHHKKVAWLPMMLCDTSETPIQSQMQKYPWPCSSTRFHNAWAHYQTQLSHHSTPFMWHLLHATRAYVQQWACVQDNLLQHTTSHGGYFRVDFTETNDEECQLPMTCSSSFADDDCALLAYRWDLKFSKMIGWFELICYVANVIRKKYPSWLVACDKHNSFKNAEPCHELSLEAWGAWWSSKHACNTVDSH